MNFAVPVNRSHMNPHMSLQQEKELRRMAQVMIDAADGKPIQSRYRHSIHEEEWRDNPRPDFGWPHYDYRVKPDTE